VTVNVNGSLGSSLTAACCGAVQLIESPQSSSSTRVVETGL